MRFTSIKRSLFTLLFSLVVILLLIVNSSVLGATNNGNIVLRISKIENDKIYLTIRYNPKQTPVVDLGFNLKFDSSKVSYLESDSSIDVLINSSLGLITLYTENTPVLNSNSFIVSKLIFELKNEGKFSFIADDISATNIYGDILNISSTTLAYPVSSGVSFFRNLFEAWYVWCVASVLVFTIVFIGIGVTFYKKGRKQGGKYA